MSANIKYRGRVSINIKNKPPLERHNEGTNILFNTLHDILARNVTYQTYAAKLPCFMSIVNAYDNRITSYYDSNLTGKILINPVSIVSRTATDNEVILTSNINSSNIIQSNIIPKPTVLLLDGEYKILAYAAYDDIDFNELLTNPSYTGVITWKMSFTNDVESKGEFSV